MKSLGSVMLNIANGVSVPLRACVTHASLLRMLLRREIVNRSSGTLLGRLWPLLQPALQVLGFWFMFDVVYGMRRAATGDFLAYLLTGMLPWLLLMEVLNRSAGMFREFASLYRRTPFPIELLPVLIMLIPGAVYTLVYFVVCLLMHGPLGAMMSLAVIPLVLLWLLPLVLLFSVLGLFIRDFAQALPFILTLVMYSTPILYFPSMLPAGMQRWLWLNPFADLVALAQAISADTVFDPHAALRLVLVWLVLLGIAWPVFRRALPHIREVL